MGIISEILRMKGLQIHALPRPSSDFIPPKDQIKEIYNRIKTFGAENNEDPRAWCRYLDRERIAFFHEIVAKYQSVSKGIHPRSIADAGCGSGYLLRILADKNSGSQLVGYDTYQKGLLLAEILAASAKFHLKGIDQIEDEHDLIFCTEVLEHMLRPEDAVKHLFQNLNIGGGLFLTVPNGRYDHQEAGELRADGTAYWGHVHFWSPESWALFLAGCLPEASEIESGVIGGDKLFGWIVK